MVGVGHMVFYAIVRGPLGIGKTTVCERLAEELGAAYISIDRILDKHGLWESGELAEFLRANQFVADLAVAFLARGTPVIIDGNFYWKAQIEDLIARLQFAHYVFTLEAPLKVCIERDQLRCAPHGPAAAREVFVKTTAFDYGVSVDAARPLEAVVSQILHQLPPEGSRS
jgi:predicted kinase